MLREKSHLDHTITFKDFMFYPIYEIWRSHGYGFVSHNENMIIHLKDVVKLKSKDVIHNGDMYQTWLIV